MVAHDDCAVAEQVRLDALEWAVIAMADLHQAITRDPADRQARLDASLILSALDELVTGREPKTLMGSQRRISRTPTAEEWRRLVQLQEIRRVMPRPQGVRRQRATAPGLEEAPVGGVWHRLAHLAALDAQEARALWLHGGCGRPLREVARALGLSRRQADKVTASGRHKLERYTSSRQLRSVDELMSVL